MGLTERALRELLRILESGVVPSDGSASSDLFFAVREALESRQQLTELRAKLAAAEKALLESAGREQALMQGAKDALALADKNWKSWNSAENERVATKAQLAAATERAEHISDALAYQNAALRAALEEVKRYVPEEISVIGPVDPRDGVPDSVFVSNPDYKVLIDALALTPPDAMKEENTCEK